MSLRRMLLGVAVLPVLVSPAAAVDNMMCYQARLQSKTPAPPQTVLDVDDGFSTGLTRLGPVRRVCAPATVGVTAPSDPDARLICHVSKDVPSQLTANRAEVQVTNPVAGTWRLRLKQTEQACLQADVGGHVASQPLDNYRCYKVVLSNGQPAWPVLVVDVGDVHYASRSLTLEKPSRVCEPVTINNDPPADPAAVVVCYGVTEQVPSPQFTPVNEPVTTEFAQYAVTERARPKPVLCIPSTQAIVL